MYAPKPSRWRCPKHKRFDPRDGRGAVKGNCRNCNLLCDLSEVIEKARTVGLAVHKRTPPSVAVAMCNEDSQLFLLQEAEHNGTNTR